MLSQKKDSLFRCQQLKFLCLVPTRQSGKMCNLYEVSVSEADTRAVPFMLTFLPLSSKYYEDSLSMNADLYTVLVTVINAEQTYICNISVWCCVVKVLTRGADSLQIPLCMYTLKVFLFPERHRPSSRDHY